MKFAEEVLDELVWGGEVDGLEFVESKLVRTSRWSHHYRVVFKHLDKHYRVNYSVGATESQGGGFEFDDVDEGKYVECHEVMKVQVLVDTWLDKET